MFKWGLFKKDIAETHLPEELKEQMKFVYEEHSGSDRAVLVLDQLSHLVREQKREMDEMADQIQDMEFRLEQSYREKNFQADLLTSMCDEIQAPIHTINQLGDWLNQTHLDANQRACFDFYRSTARKLNDMFQNIIDVTRLREGIFKPDPITFQLSEVVNEIMQAVSLTAQEKGIPFKVDVDPDVPHHLIGDIKRLEQILVSLVNNAIKFTYEGEVRVLIQKETESESEGECTLAFMVQDSGMGIPENQIHSIFDRLAQGDPDVERNYGGTGLGLYICKGLVEQMGGTIWAENRKEGGATFGFSIPFENGSIEETLEPGNPLVQADDPVVPESKAMAQLPGDDKSVYGPQKMKILVVDDCPDTCRLIERFLESGPFDVDVVNDGVRALDKYQDNQYDLILMDIQLPHLDGVGATMEIRNKESLQDIPKTPIFALVGDSSNDDDGYYLAGDFDRCLMKPVSKDLLLEAINHLDTPRS